MKFKIINFGCKVNTYESTYLEEKLINNGYTETLNDADADIIIINTCSVTNVADQKCRKTIRKIKRENEKAIIVATGCSVQNNIEIYKELGINILVDNFHKSLIPDLIEEYKTNKKDILKYENNRNQPFENMHLDRFVRQTRAFVKIQDGCDNFCSYCVIPLLRGSIRSKDFNTVISEVKDLADNGHKEIVLVGIHTGSYSSNGKDLVDLIDEISKIEKVKKIRLSSVEITELNDKFLNLLKNNKKLVSHLHIPLQCGSDTILKLMNRKYDKEYFKNKIKTIRSIRPNINITTDVIVGHPGETDELFNESLEFCKEMSFGKIHVFPYSKRDNTKASIMPNQVDELIKKKRVIMLLRLSDIMQKEYEEKFINKELDIITEINHQNEVVGFTDNYIKVKVTNPENLKANEIITVLLNKYDNNIIEAKYIKKEN